MSQEILNNFQISSEILENSKILQEILNTFFKFPKKFEKFQNFRRKYQRPKVDIFNLSPQQKFYRFTLLLRCSPRKATVNPPSRSQMPCLSITVLNLKGFFVAAQVCFQNNMIMPKEACCALQRVLLSFALLEKKGELL